MHRRANWRYWYLPSGMRGQCGPTTVVYSRPRFTVRYKVRFRSEGVNALASLGDERLDFVEEKYKSWAAITPAAPR